MKSLGVFWVLLLAFGCAESAPPKDGGRSGDLEAIARASNLKPSRMPARLLRFLAHNPGGYDLSNRGAAGDLLLGDLLYHSPRTLGARAQGLGLSCQSCHPNGATNPQFFIPGISDRPGNVDLSTAFFRAGADNRVDDAVNIPSLRGARYKAPFGHDGRTASLSEFIQNVVVGEFGGRPLSASQLSALTSYVQQIDFLPNRLLNSQGSLAPAASDGARRGEILFHVPRRGLYGRSCSSCHIPSTYFQDGKVHRHGSARRASPHSLDDGVRTSTLINTFETAPYFHDGRFRTLEEVVAWYEREFHLELTPADQCALVEYLKAVGSGEPPEDDRPITSKLMDHFSYIALLTDQSLANDSGVWAAALELILEGMSSQPEVPRVTARIRAARELACNALDRCLRGEPPANLASGVDVLRRELPRLAADWAGALMSERR